ncbi:MAG: hypothetical protein OXF20_00670 [Gammaproteobacteria bacterium]|nr:hypothetical protein [Gammaproteobacteria bacterium]
MSLLKNPAILGKCLRSFISSRPHIGVIELARHLHVPRTRIERLIRQETALSVERRFDWRNSTARLQSTRSTCSGSTISLKPSLRGAQGAAYYPQIASQQRGKNFTVLRISGEIGSKNTAQQD